MNIRVRLLRREFAWCQRGAMTDPATDPKAVRRESFVHRIWPTAVVVIGLGLTVIWIGALAFGLIKIIQNAI